MKNLRINENVKEFFADLTFLHGEKQSARRAFLLKEKRALLLRLPRSLGITEAVFEYTENEVRREIPFSFSSVFRGDDIYIASLSDLGVGLYFGRIRAHGIFGVYYSTLSRSTLRFVKNEVSDTVQISVSSFPSPQKNPYLGGVIYHIFVDRFAKGKRFVPIKEDAKIIENWENGIPEYPSYPGAHLENNTFYGGTLYGVIERLDDLRSLGVTLLYLSPIFEAYSNHKYDTADYMSVDSMFGGEEALRLLIKEAACRGIGIILDGVFNHTGSDSIYFNKKGRYPGLGAYQSKKSPYYSWYDFQKFPNDYTCWWGIPILPRIHPDRKECREYFLGKDGVIEKYAEMGIAGFRLDVADELSDAFIAGIKRVLLKENKNALLFGEVWEDASNKIAYGIRKKYYLGRELDGVMNYPLRKALLSYVMKRETEELKYVFFEVYQNTPKRILDMQMNLLGTHDTERILTVLGGESAEGRTNAELASLRMTKEQRALAGIRLRMLYTVLATLPGLPMIYYGDEVGLEGYSDPFNRLPYPFGNEDTELLMHYRRLGKIRSENSVYKDGEFSLLVLTEDILVFSRESRAFVYITIMNQGKTQASFAFSEKVKELLSEENASLFSVPALSSIIVRCKKNIRFKIK